jgi:hypothetical protein
MLPPDQIGSQLCNLIPICEPGQVFTEEDPCQPLPDCDPTNGIVNTVDMPCSDLPKCDLGVTYANMASRGITVGTCEPLPYCGEGNYTSS